MDPVDANAIAQEWTRVVARHWDDFAGERPNSMGFQEAVGTGLADHLRSYVPDGESFAFRGDAGWPGVGTIAPDVLYVTTVDLLNSEDEQVAIATRRFPLDDRAHLEVSRVCPVWGQPLAERWMLRRDPHQVVIIGARAAERSFPRALAARLGWEVPVSA